MSYNILDKLKNEDEIYENLFTVALIIILVEFIIYTVAKKWEIHIKNEINNKIINFKAKPDYFPEKERALASIEDANLSKKTLTTLATGKINNVGKTNLAHIAQFSGAAGGDIFNRGDILPYERSNLIPNATIKEELDFLIKLEKTFIMLKTQIMQHSTNFYDDYDKIIKLYNKLRKTGKQIIQSAFLIFTLGFLQNIESIPACDLSVSVLFLTLIFATNKIYKYITILSDLSMTPSQY